MKTKWLVCLIVLLSLSLLTAQAEPAQQQPPPPTSPPPDAQKTEAPKPKPTLKLPGSELATPQQPQQTPDAGTIKLDTSLVLIPVSVIDRDGKYIPNLTKDGFQIFEDGIKQEIDHFSSVEAPFNVVLLLDTSGSTRFKIEDIQRAALTFVDQLRPQDRVMVVSFDQRVYIDSEFTGDRAQLRRAIHQTRTGGSTRLYDAVDLVLTERLNKMTGRKAIILFTDGVDTMSQLATSLSTIDRVEESGVLLYPIQYDTQANLGSTITVNGKPMRPAPGSPGSPEAYERASKYLRELADRTGARHYQAETIENAERAFALIAEELRHQYSLSYYPANVARDGSYRRIRVTVNQPNVVVRARAGYRAASSPPNDIPLKDNTARPIIKQN
jgi:VWFA-related protein